MKTTDFTANEIAVLKAMHVSMSSNGFDFGFGDDCTKNIEGLSRKSAASVLRGLHKKVRILHDSEYDQIYVEWVKDESDDNDMPRYGADFDEFLSKLLPR